MRRKMNKIADFDFQISTISVENDSTTLNMEAEVGKYGKVYLSITLLASSNDRNSGTYLGDARTITGDGEMIAASLQGLWKREGTIIQAKGLDNASNGDQNYAEATFDLIQKTWVGSVYDVWS
jgi:hypothetical protein